MRKLTKILCVICGNAFTGRADAKTCSATCRKRLQRQNSLKARLMTEAKQLEQTIETDIAKVEQAAINLLPKQPELIPVTIDEGLDEVFPTGATDQSKAIPISVDSSDEAQPIAVRSERSEMSSGLPGTGTLSAPAHLNLGYVSHTSDEQLDSKQSKRGFRRFAGAMVVMLLLLGTGVVGNWLLGNGNHTKINQLDNSQRNQTHILKQQITYNTKVNQLQLKVNDLSTQINNLKVANSANSSGGSVVNNSVVNNSTADNGPFNGPNELVQLTSTGQLPVLDGSNLTNVDATTLQGHDASYFTNASNIISGTLADARLSANVALLDGINHFQPATDSTTAFRIQNSAGSITLFNADTIGGGALTFGVPVTFNSGVTFNSLSPPGNTPLCLNGSNMLSTCTGGGGGGGVTSLDSQIGNLTIANSSASGSTIIIQNASTTQKGLAQFNSTNFSDNGSGVINTIQNINSGASPTFTGLTLSGLGTGVVQATSGVLSASNTLSATVQGNITTVGALTAGSIGGSFGNINIGSNTFTGNGSGLTNLNGANLTAGSVANAALTNSSITINSGTGLQGGGTVALGGTTSLNVDFGSSAGQAVQGNTVLTCASGTGNLSGGGNAVTLGSGGTCGNIAISTTPSFTSLTTTGAAGITVGVAGTTPGKLVLASAGSGSVTLQTASQANAVALSIPADTNTTDTICLVNLGNCTGSSGGSGNTNYIFNQTSQQASSNFNISGTGVIGSGLTVTGLGTGVVQATSGVLSTGAVALGTQTTGNYVANLGTLTGLTTSGNSGAGSTPTLSVTYGAIANTAVQGNTILTCPSGTGNLAGGGTSITLGTGGTCGALNTVNNPSFSGAVTLGTSATTAGQLIFNTTGSGAVTLQSAAQANAIALSIPADTNTADSICLQTLANCTFSGTAAGGDLTGTYPNPTIAKLQGTTLTISSIASGDVLQYNGSAVVNGHITNSNLQGGSFTNITGVGALTVGSIGGTFGNINIGSNIFTGDGSGLTNLNGTNITTGTVADARLSGNIAFLNGTGPQTFTGNNKFTGTVLSQNTTNSTAAFQIQGTAATSGTNLLTADTTNNQLSVNGQLSVTGGLNISDLSSAPTGVALSVGGSNNGQTYTYRVSAVTANGNYTAGSSAVTTNSGPSTISNNTITWNGVVGAAKYYVYRTQSSGTPSSTGYIGTILANNNTGSNTYSFSDTGIAATTTNGATGTTASTAYPTIDTSGQLTANGPALFQDSTNSTTAFQIQNASGTPLLTGDTSNAELVVRGGNNTATVGSELITDGTFAGGTWTSTGWTVASSNATHVTGNTNALSTTQVSVIAGSTYQVSFAASGSNSNTQTVTPAIGGVNGTPILGNDATDVQVITAGSTGPLQFIPTSTWIGIISNVSVKLISQQTAELAVQDSTGTTALEVRTSLNQTSIYIGLNAGINANTCGLGQCQNVGIGFNSLRNDTLGGGNVAVGNDTLSNNTIGSANTAVGRQALSANITGSSNVAIGNQSLFNNTIGLNNTAAGYQSLQSNINGNSLTAVGNLALQSNTTGSNNVAIGDSALKANTTSNNSTAVGYQSLLKATGASNTAVGASAANNFTTGTNNAVLGFSALGGATTSASDNAALGFQALNGVTTGNKNIGIGSSTGIIDATHKITTGSNNIFIGYGSAPNVLAASNQLQNAIAIGGFSTVDQSNALILGCVNTVNGCTATTTVGIGSAFAPNALTVSPGTYGTNGTAGTATTISQTTTAITGSGTTFTTAMTGGTIYYSDGTTATVTFVSTTSLTSSASKTVAALSTYTIVYGGFNITATATASLQPTSDSTTAFQIQNAANTATLFAADTTNLVITISGKSDASTFASLTLTNAHFKSTQTTAPTAGTPSTCGTSPPAATVTAASTDSAGSFTITEGSGTAGLCAAVFTFNKAYGGGSTAPKSVILTPKDTNGSTARAYVSATSATTFTVTFGATITASTAANYYYWVIE